MNTVRLLAILEQLEPYGISIDEALLDVVGPFPVAGLASWHDDWHAPRCCPTPHLHVGIDILAARGTPIVASYDGYISQKVDVPESSGLGVEITAADGTQYFYAHLDEFAPGIDRFDQVVQGQVLGYIGTTGNSPENVPHVHFEVQPNGVPVPPLPYITQWLALAEAKASQMVLEVTGSLPTIDLTALQPWLDQLALLVDDALARGTENERIFYPDDNLGAPVRPQPTPEAAAGGEAPGAPPSGPVTTIPVAPVDDMTPVAALTLSGSALVILAALHERRRSRGPVPDNGRKRLRFRRRRPARAPRPMADPVGSSGPA